MAELHLFVDFEIETRIEHAFELVMGVDCLCLNKGLPMALLLLWDRASVYVQKVTNNTGC
ncbi:hypothetical protein ACE6H2_018697 [Prunus campanulata]